MAVEVEKLLVTLEARIGQYNKDLLTAQTQTNRQLTAMEARFAAWSTKLKGSASTAAMGIGGAFAGIGALLGTQAVLEYANAWTRTTRAVDASGRVFGIALKPAEQLNQLANDARVDLEAYSKLYIRTSAAIRDYGFEAGTAEKVTSTLAKALKLGGASASEQTSVLLQFSQALQKGKLDGDEFRTVMENAGVVQELLAKRLNVTKGRIIELAADGKLQIKDLVGAMVDGGDSVDRIFRQMPATIDEAFAVLRNNVIEFIGQADQATGASGRLSEAIVTISQNLGALAVAAGAILGSATVRMVAFAAASVAAANPLTLIAAAIGGLGVAYGVFGDQISISSDKTVSLKDSLAGFLDVAGGDARETLQKLSDVFTAMIERTTAWGLTWGNVTGTVQEVAGALGKKVAELDQKFGGYGAAIVNAFVSANKQLADTLGITSAINLALAKGADIAERAAQISNERALVGKNYGGRLGDYYAGKIQDPKIEGPSRADPNAKRSEFEREVAQIKKRTAALQAELETINQSVFAQERAKAIAELRSAAEETARKAGRKVSAEEIAAIDTLATKYADTQTQVAFLNALKSRKDGIETARTELSLIGLYGQELDAARIKLELLNEAKRLGVEVSPGQAQEIDALAKSEAALKAYRDAIQEINEVSADALKGFISDLQEGKSATEALANALGKLGDKLIDAGVNQLVNSLVGGSTGPGSGFASLFGFADGGIAANGRPVPLKRFANGGISNTAAIFGEAGPEAAIPLKGGKVPVELRMPNIPKAAAASSNTTMVTVAPVFNVENGTPEGVEKLKSDIVPTIQRVVGELFDRSPRFARSRI